MTWTIYRDSDEGAPQFLGARDSYNNALLAILVNGYGSKPGAGWTSPYSATGLRVFKQGASGNNRYLRVYNRQTSGDASYGWLFNMAAYETMTAVSTGTARWPTTAQQSGNGLWGRYRDLNTYDEGAGPVNPKWMCIANDSFFAMFICASGNPEEIGGDASSGFTFFGKFDSEKSGDTYGDIIGGGATSAYTGYYGNSSSFGCAYVTRAHSLTGGSIPAALYSTTVRPGFASFGDGTVPLPDPVSGKMILEKVHIQTSTTGDILASSFRGVLPCMYTHPHPKASLPANVFFSGNAENAGRQFQMKNITDNGYRLAVEVSGTWT